jgi:hypothetical protein
MIWMSPRSDSLQPEFFYLSDRPAPSTQVDHSRPAPNRQEEHHAELSDAEDIDLDDTDLRGDEELLAEPLQEQEFIQESQGTGEVVPHAACDRDADGGALLDEASLNTVLDILSVLTTVEELAMLEALSTVQKRQVWSKTPEAVKDKLKRLRDANQTRSVPLDDQTSVALAHGDGNQLSLHVGDWVVLAANPKLTKAELVAIWDVVEVHEDYARIKTQHLGLRNYPIDWIVRYPKPVST